MCLDRMAGSFLNRPSSSMMIVAIFRLLTLPVSGKLSMTFFRMLTVRAHGFS